VPTSDGKSERLRRTRVGRHATTEVRYDSGRRDPALPPVVQERFLGRVLPAIGGRCALLLYELAKPEGTRASSFAERQAEMFRSRTVHHPLSADAAERLREAWEAAGCVPAHRAAAAVLGGEGLVTEDIYNFTTVPGT